MKNINDDHKKKKVTVKNKAENIEKSCIVRTLRTIE